MSDWMNPFAIYWVLTLNLNCISLGDAMFFSHFLSQSLSCGSGEWAIILGWHFARYWIRPRNHFALIYVFVFVVIVLVFNFNLSSSSNNQVIFWLLEHLFFHLLLERVHILDVEGIIDWPFWVRSQWSDRLICMHMAAIAVYGAPIWRLRSWVFPVILSAEQEEDRLSRLEETQALTEILVGRSQSTWSSLTSSLLFVLCLWQLLLLIQI